MPMVGLRCGSQGGWGS